MAGTPLRPPQACDVLIVEDDVRLGDTMAAFLRRNGVDVRIAVSGASALRLLEALEPRVGVFDYILPDLTGLDLAQAVRKQFPELPIILMSGSVDSLDQSGLREAGIMVFVNKPLPLRALFRAIVQLIERRT